MRGPGGDGIDIDVKGTGFKGQLSGKCNDTGLGGGVIGARCIPQATSRHGAQQHYFPLPLPLHHGQNGPRTDKSTRKVQLNIGPPYCQGRIFNER